MPLTYLRLDVERIFEEEFVGKTNDYLETRTLFYLHARITPNRCFAMPNPQEN